MAPPLVVDPEALFAVGSAVAAAGEGLTANLTILTSGFAAHTGLDAAGTMFGLAYQGAAESLLKAAAAAINACRQCGALIQQGASNYSRAEAASTLGGGGDVLEAPPAPAKISSPGPPGTWGKGEPPPLLWAVVQSFVDDLWPDGDVGGIRAAATRWRGFAGAAGGMRNALSGAKALLDAQQIPEGGKIDGALSQIGDCMGKIGDASGELATSLDNFADEVAGAQNAIRDLLHRLGSLTDIGHDLMLIVKGDALDEITKIAKDINHVLHDLGREARAAEQEMKMGLQIADGLVVKFEKYVRGELTQFLGDEVGNPVATVFDTWVNTNEGVVKGAAGLVLALGDLDPRWFVLDPKGAATTWSDLGKSLWKGSLINAFLNPQEATEANVQMFKSLLHLDDWSTARPGLGFGENLFDVVSFFIPGGGEASAAADGAGVAARGGEAAAESAGRGARAVGGLRGLAGVRGELADIAEAGGDLTKGLDGAAENLPTIDPVLGGRPVELPAPKPLDPPVESAPRSPDAALGRPHGPAPAEPREPVPVPHEPVSGPHEPAVAPHEPVGAPHQPASAPVGGPPRAYAPIAAGERVPSTVPQFVDHAAPVPVAPGGPAHVAAHAIQPVPSFSAPTPHFAPPPGHQPQLPAPGGGGWHPPPGDGSALGGRPHGSGPHGPGDARPHSDPSDEGSTGKHESPDGTDPATGETSDPVLPTPAKVPGVDYSLPAPDALRVLEHPGAELKRLADGGVPHTILDGYEPLAGRTVDEFGHEFTVRGPDGKISWDWDTQAPHNGFAGVPAETTHIPKDLRLDRLGSNAGGFLSPEGAPLAERGTPPGLAAQYRLFEGTGREIPPGRDWIVQHGPAKAAFGQPGGGEQWIVLDKRTEGPVSMTDLLLERLIKDITPKS